MPRLRELLLLLAAAGCHAPTPTRLPLRQPGEVVLDASAGARIVTIVRATPGVVRVSLWLDAGSRDASPPQVATLAAWLAAESGGPEVRATVYPDATELARDCTSAALGACVAELQKALATRGPSEARVLAARLKLREGRRLALAHDPVRRADVAALRALLGDAAAGFFPLGAADDDARADTASVDAFLRAHYGPQRALFIAAGDAAPERVRSAVADTLQGAPAAASARAERTLGPAASGRAEVLIDDRDAVTFALAAPDLERAQGVAVALQRALGRDPDAAIATSGDVFAVRGGALALLRLRGRDLDTTLLQGARELARLALETPTAVEARPTGNDDLASLSLAFAQSWTTKARSQLTGGAFAAALLVRGGRGDKPRVQDPDAAERMRRQTRAQGLLDQALIEATPQLRGAIDAHAASVVVSNGARIEARRVRGDDVAIVVRSALGAGQDPPLFLGRSALLATLASTACAGMGPRQLAAELGRMRATLSPRVDAESYGVLLRAPSAAWREALDVALRCMQTPSLDPVHVASAILRLQARLGGARSALGWRALVASLVAPRAPGVYAPWGDPARLGNANARELATLLPQARSGARWVVALVGDIDVPEATQRAARRLAPMPPGGLPSAPVAGEIALLTQLPRSSAVPSTVLAIWRTRETAPDALAARVSAAALQAALTRSPGVEATWRGGAAHGGDAWAALVLRVQPAALPNLAATLTAAGARCDDATLAEALTRASEQEHVARAGAASRVDIAADRLARDRLAASPSREPSAESTLATARNLLRAAPVYIAID